MSNALYRTVHGAITAFHARVKSAVGNRTKSDPELSATGDPTGPCTLMSYPFHQRALFTSEMGAQLDECSDELDLIEAKLRHMRNHVVNLRNLLAGSQGATEATWPEVRSGFDRDRSELLTGVRHARTWTGVRDGVH